ncbi:MAG TPA: DUF4349 domain-containing protein [Caulobacteraceae bacterium]
MKRVLLLLAAVSLTALAACDKRPADNAGGGQPTASADATPGDSAKTTTASDAPPPTPRAPMLAMAYHLDLALPSDQVRPLMESHQEACERAGPNQCQVVGAQAQSEGKDDESATLDLRATPAWMRAFRGRAEADVKDAGGRILQSGTQSEDLARAIGDTQAGQKTRAEEEARLKELLARRMRHLDDSLAVEQEITQVQNDLNAQASSLQDMQDRVAMQTLSIAYEPNGAVAPRGSTAPLAAASRAFWGHMMEVFAGLLTIASYILPFVIVIAPIGWLIARRGRPAPKPRPPSA